VLAPLDHAQRDLGAGRVEGEAERTSVGSLYARHAAGLDVLGPGHVGAEDPGMAAQHTRLAPLPSVTSPALSMAAGFYVTRGYAARGGPAAEAGSTTRSCGH
jgi:hypothetical protein